MLAILSISAPKFKLTFLLRYAFALSDKVREYYSVCIHRLADEFPDSNLSLSLYRPQHLRGRLKTVIIGGSARVGTVAI